MTGNRFTARGVCLGLALAVGVSQPLAAKETKPGLLGSYLAGRYASAVDDASAASDYYLRAAALDPENSELLRRAFSAVVADGRLAEAVDLAARLEAMNSGTGVTRLVLLADDLLNGRYDEVLETTEGAPQAGFNALMTPVVRAWALAGQGKTEDAIKTLEPLAKTRSFTSYESGHAAMIRDFAGEDASADYERVIADKSGVAVRDILAYALYLKRTGKKRDALGLLDEFVERFLGNPILADMAERVADGSAPKRLVSSPAEGVSEALFAIANTLAIENTSGAASIYLRLATFLRGEFWDARLLLADILQRQGRLKAALTEFQRIDAKSPLAWNARLRTAYLLNQMKRSEEAISLLHSLVAERPNDLDALTGLADMLREQSRFSEARRFYDHSLSLLPDLQEQHWTLLYARGITLERDSKWDDAEKDFLKALDLKPEQPYVLNYLGYSWVEQGRNLERARAMIERAVELLPNDGYIVDSLGWAHFRLGDFAQSVPYLEKAVLLQPGDPTINEHLGDAYWKVGRKLEARFQWRHALASKPEEEQAALLREKLRHGLDARPGDNG